MAKILNETMMITYRFIHVGKTCFKNAVIRRPVKVLNLPAKKTVETINVPRIKSLKNASKGESVPAIIKKPEENVVSYEKLSKYDSRFM